MKAASPRIPGRAIHRGVGVDSSNTNAVESYYRINFYYPALDAIIQDMNLRFGKQQEFSVQFCRVIPALLSTNVNQDWESVFKAVRMYQSMFEDTEENIKLEYELWVAKWQAVELEYRPSTAIEHCPT